MEGVESVHMLRKGQVKRLDGRDSAGQAKFVESLFGVADIDSTIGLYGGEQYYKAPAAASVSGWADFN